MASPQETLLVCVLCSNRARLCWPASRCPEDVGRPLCTDASRLGGGFQHPVQNWPEHARRCQLTLRALLPMPTYISAVPAREGRLRQAAGAHFTEAGHRPGEACVLRINTYLRIPRRFGTGDLLSSRRPFLQPFIPPPSSPTTLHCLHFGSRGRGVGTDLSGRCFPCCVS